MIAEVKGLAGMAARITCALAILFVLAVPGCGKRAEVKPLYEEPERTRAFDLLREIAAEDVTVAGAGDVNLGDGVAPYLSAGGVDYPWPDARVIFELAELAFVNLECCISSRGSPAPGKEFTFRGPADSGAGLGYAGVDVVSLANNHFKDYGTDAMLDTLVHLEESGVARCGAGINESQAYSPAMLEVHGKEVYFVAFNSIVPYGWAATGDSPGCATTWDPDRVAREIRNADEKADYVVASFHWGMELHTSPSSEQRALAHLAVDSGADLVLGHHPHVVQGFELYENRLIAYSLGNFVFSPPREISSKTVAVIALLGPDGLVQAKVIPMMISRCRPVIASGSVADSWIRTVAGYSQELGTEMRVSDERGFITPERQEAGGSASL